MEYAETNPTFDPRWAIYASGPDQAYLDAQVQRLREAAPGMGLTHEPAMTWGEIVPGTGADRPERDDVLRSAESRQFSYLLVVSPSQLSQDIQEFAEICRRISRAGVVYHFLDRSPFDSPYDPVLMDLMAVHEKRMFSQRIKQGLEHAAKRGSLPGGTAPFGYDRDLDTKSWRGGGGHDARRDSPDFERAGDPNEDRTAVDADGSEADPEERNPNRHGPVHGRPNRNYPDHNPRDLRKGSAVVGPAQNQVNPQADRNGPLRSVRTRRQRTPPDRHTLVRTVRR